MSETAKQPTETSEPEEPAERASTGGVALLAAWNYSLADFYARRLRRYWKYPFELAEKRTLEGVAQSLIDFEKELLSDYADQANELQRISLGRRRKEHGAPSREYERRLLEAQKDAASIIEQAKLQAERIVASAKSRAERMTAEEEAPHNAARKRA